MARHFNGTSDQVASAASSLPTAPSAYTWALWVNGDSPPSTTGTSQFFSVAVNTGSPSSTRGFWNLAGTDFCCRHTNGANNSDQVQFSSTAVGSVWDHVAAVWSGSSLALYFNGILAATDSSVLAQSLQWTSTNRLTLGNTAGGAQWFAGSIVDAAFWSTALSAGQIAALASGYRANHVAPNNMLVYWPIVGVSPEPDRSGNNINGTVTGTTVVADPPQLEPYQFAYYPTAPLTGTILVLPAAEW